MNKVYIFRIYAQYGILQTLHSYIHPLHTYISTGVVEEKLTNKIQY